MEKLYKFCWNCNYGTIEGIFISTKEKVKTLIGEEIYFGEILGKHSEVYGTIEKNEITEIKASEEYISETKKLFGNTVVGYNPFDFIDNE